MSKHNRHFQVNEPDRCLCKFPLAMYSYMRPMNLSSLQYPTRLVKFLWWTLIRSLTWKWVNPTSIRETTQNPYKRIEQKATHLCLKLFVSLCRWLRQHLHCNLGIIWVAMVDSSKSTVSNNSLKVVSDIQDFRVCKLMICWLQWPYFSHGFGFICLHPSSWQDN